MKALFVVARLPLGLEGSVLLTWRMDSSQWKSADGNLQIVFNGEIYDYKELRAELEAAGISFRTHSDTEVLVNTIQKYGENAIWTSCGECRICCVE